VGVRRVANLNWMKAHSQSLGDGLAAVFLTDRTLLAPAGLLAARVLSGHGYRGRVVSRRQRRHEPERTRPTGVTRVRDERCHGSVQERPVCSVRTEIARGCRLGYLAQFGAVPREIVEIRQVNRA